jgi:transcriptional regulator with XRE-family HTH domain
MSILIILPKIIPVNRFLYFFLLFPENSAYLLMGKSLGFLCHGFPLPLVCIQCKSGLNKKEFAESLGVAKEQGSMLGRGRQKATREVLIKLAHSYGMDLTWYITGEGDPETGPGTVSIALYDQEAAAGRGIEIDEYQERRLIPVPSELIGHCNPAKVRAVSVSGGSMIGAGINDKGSIFFY